ncbi:MAG: LytTR family DNA-binding domain-containing protein [Massilia sp.]
MSRPTAILAEDEALLRTQLRLALAQFWPELQIVGEAEDGIAAARLLEQCQPQIAFLDVRMPSLNGLEVARLTGGRCHVVFLTAFQDYAVDAFNQGAVDYLLKPLDSARLAVTVQRLKAVLARQPADLSGLQAAKPAGKLQWIQASTGNQLRFISINDVLGFCADAKYTCVMTRKFDAHIRTTIKDLALQLDGEQFWQISRGTIVNIAAIHSLQRVDGNLSVRLAENGPALAVSQAYQHQFRQM